MGGGSNAERNRGREKKLFRKKKWYTWVTPQSADVQKQPSGYRIWLLHILLWLEAREGRLHLNKLKSGPCCLCKGRVPFKRELFDDYRRKFGGGIPDVDPEGLSSNWENEGMIRPYRCVAFVQAWVGIHSLRNILECLWSPLTFSRRGRRWWQIGRA